MIRNKNNIEIITERILQKLILEDIESFMKELGSSFNFIGSDIKLKLVIETIMLIYFYLIMNIIVFVL